MCCPYYVSPAQGIALPVSCAVCHTVCHPCYTSRCVLHHVLPVPVSPTQSIVPYITPPTTHTICCTAHHLHRLSRHLVVPSCHTTLLCRLSWVPSVAPPHVMLQHAAVHCTMAVQWCWHATCTQRLFSNKQSIVTYLVTEPMLKRKSKWQRVVTQKKVT